MGRVSGRAPRTERHVRETPVGIHVATGAVVVLAALMVSAMMPASAGAWRLAPVAAALFAFGRYCVDPVAVGLVALLAYLLVVGFLENRLGVLTWHGAADAYRLAAVTGAALAGLAVGAERRRNRRPGPLIVPPEWVAVTPVDPRALMLTNKEEFPGG